MCDIIDEKIDGTPGLGKEKSSWQVIWSREKDTGYWTRKSTIRGEWRTRFTDQVKGSATSNMICLSGRTVNNDNNNISLPEQI